MAYDGLLYAPAEEQYMSFGQQWQPDIEIRYRGART